MKARLLPNSVLRAFLLIALGGCRAPSPDMASSKPAVFKRSSTQEPAPPPTPDRGRIRQSPAPLPEGVLYQGPTGLRGWISYESATKDWRYSDGALWTKSAHWIGRDVHLPERSSVEFTLSNPGLISAFFVSLYTKVPLKVTYSPEYHVANYYTLSIFRDTLLFQRLNAEGHEQYLGKTSNLYSYPRPSVRVKILTDRPARKFWVFFDRTQVAQWEDPGSFAGEGTGVVFQAFAQEEELSIRDIKVSVWDGTF